MAADPGQLVDVTPEEPADARPVRDSPTTAEATCWADIRPRWAIIATIATTKCRPTGEFQMCVPNKLLIWDGQGARSWLDSLLRLLKPG